MLRRPRKSRFFLVLLNLRVIMSASNGKWVRTWLIGIHVWVPGIQVFEFVRVFQPRRNCEAEAL